MIIENEKVDCIDAIVFELTRTIEWRKKMATRYPQDARNAKAAKSLTSLASDVAALSDNDWIRLKPHSGWASEHWRRSISDAARAVGFKEAIRGPRNLHNE
jgi:hypothetical protein